jgi:transcriptional regulator with XRE-family HTH domain
LRPLEGVKDLRERRMLSQQELAERAGVSLFTIQRIERGEGSVRPKTGRAIASALGVGVEDLLPKKVQAPPSPQPSFNDVLGEEQRYALLASLLEDWYYLIEQTAERHIENASSTIFETVEGASAYCIEAYTETAQLFEICLERLSPTIHNTLPESLAELEGGKLTQAMFRLEEAEVAIGEAAKAAGVAFEHEQELSEAELALMDEAAREFEALSELEQRRQMREAWEIVDRLARERIRNAKELTEEVRRQSSA